MVVVAKHRLRGDGRIWVDQSKTKVLRDAGGWYVVRGLSPSDEARVLFRPIQDMLVLEHHGQFLRIPFHGGEGTFTWDGRGYRIGNMVRGSLHIDQDGRLVAIGVVTVAGVRFSEVASELLPLIRPLAWALVLRSEEIAKDSRRLPPSGGGDG